jgi:hypothetical protein
MSETAYRPAALGPPSRGVTAADVERAADALLRAGVRPSVEKIRAKLGGGSPNTVNPLLDAWWKRLAARLDAGPAALHRLPESVAHVAEALWMQALEEGRRRASLEQRSSERAIVLDKQNFEVRSHVLSLREGELESRVRDRDRVNADLEHRLKELTTLLRKEQATREQQARRIATLEADLAASRLRGGHNRSSAPRPVARKKPRSKPPTKTARKPAAKRRRR